MSTWVDPDNSAYSVFLNIMLKWRVSQHVSNGNIVMSFGFNLPEWWEIV